MTHPTPDPIEMLESIMRTARIGEADDGNVNAFWLIGECQHYIEQLRSAPQAATIAKHEATLRMIVENYSDPKFRADHAEQLDQLRALLNGAPQAVPIALLEAVRDDYLKTGWNDSAHVVDYCIGCLKGNLAATPDPNMRRLTGLWRYGRDVLPTAHVDFYGFLNQLDNLIDGKANP
jgi:hypothetical protein